MHFSLVVVQHIIVLKSNGQGLILSNSMKAYITFAALQKEW